MITRGFSWDQIRQITLYTHFGAGITFRSSCISPVSHRTTLPGSKLTRNLSGNIWRQSSQLAEPLWTDPGIKSGISMHELISTLWKKKKKAQSVNERSNILPKFSHARIKPLPLYYNMVVRAKACGNVTRWGRGRSSAWYPQTSRTWQCVFHEYGQVNCLAAIKNLIQAWSNDNNNEVFERPFSIEPKARTTNNQAKRR